MNTMNPVFVSIETHAYSGATLLAFLLGTHPEIATVGEMSGLIPSENPDEYLCSCGQKIKVCEFWQAVKSAMGDRGFEFDVTRFDVGFGSSGPPLFQYLRVGSSRNHTLDSIRDRVFHAWPGEMRRLRVSSARNVALVESILEVTGKKAFVDTSKNRLRLKYLHKLSTFDVRAIHLVRDVRGVTASRLRREPGMSASEAARQWVRLNERLETTLQSLPKTKVSMLRYEDLCQDVSGTLERLYPFFRVGLSVEIADYTAVPHHIVGNVMRLRALSEIRLDERWKKQLTQKQLEEVERIAGAVSRRYGYR